MTVLRRSVRRRVAHRYQGLLRRSVAMLIGLVVAIPVLATVSAPPATAAAAADDGVLRVLLFYKANFHASHVQARQAIRDLTTELGTQYGQPVEIEETDDPAAFNTANLATKDTLAFAQTGGVLFNEAQRTALEAYIRGGGGYLGLHYAGWSVGQSEHDVNPFYLRLVGAMSEGHPENPAIRSGNVSVTDTTHPLTQGLPATFTRSDEWYDWTVNPAQNVRTLLTVDESSYQGGGGGRQGTTHPVTWCQTIDSGRSWYSGMGHDTTAYAEPVMRTQIKNGLAYTAGLLPADCSAPKKDVQGAWSGVTPWPLVPINASLTADGQVQTFGSVTSGCTDNTPYDFTGNDCVVQGGQMEFDIWNPEEPRTLANVRVGMQPNNTYTDLFCSMQVQDPSRRSVLTVGGDDQLGGNAPNDAAIGVTSYSKGKGMQNDAPMNYPRWYPTGTTMPNGDIVVQGGSLKGGPGGPGVLTPEIKTPDAGSGWKLLSGATSSAAYGDGGADHSGADENRWWYPRAFVTPGSGTLFNVTGTQMYELDPAGNGGTGQITLRGTLPTNVSNQGGLLGNPVGATSTATMYAPGKILQAGGGWWSNGGGPDGARAAFTIDITGGTANPVVTAIAPMKFRRHWPTSTLLPNGEVLVTGGSRENNGAGGYVTNAEIWSPVTGQWRTVETPYEHARLYHSSALLLPDGRVMVGGGGAPGPRNYTDVEYYSPSYLYDGSTAATRPTITTAPKKVGYDGTFQVQASGQVSRVTMLRNGSVTHGFNNDQNFQELSFTQSGNNLTITAPQDGTYAPPGAYMLYVWDAAGTPSVAKILDIDPAVKMDSRVPTVVDQFEYPRLPVEWRSANPPALIDVAPGDGRMAPWSVTDAVQLVRSNAATMGGNGVVGYHLGLGATGSLGRTLTGLDAGRDYRVSLKYARDSRSVGTADATAGLTVSGLDTTLTATTANPSASNRAITFKTYVGTFTAAARSQDLTLSAPGAAAGMMIDDLVVVAADPGVNDVPVRYEFEEGTGTSVANTGTDASVGPAVLTGTTGFSDSGIFGSSLDLPGGNNVNAVDLPDNLLQNATDFTTSFWVRPDTKGNWIGMFHLGDGLGGDGSFFQIQMSTQAAGNTGLAATFKKKGSDLQERVYATPTKDVTANQWAHVVFTRQGTTGTLYLDGVQIATRDNLTLTMTDVGPTANNWIGRNGFPDPALDGTFDDLRLYTSSLTAADVASLYADGTALRTTTAVTVSPVSPSPFAEPLTVSATVTAQEASPAAGSAELWVDGARVGESATLVEGAVSFPALTLNRGEHAIEVRYLAAAGFRDSTTTVTHTVQPPPPGVGVPIHYTFDEGTGTTAANTGADPSVGAATLQGSTGWTPNSQFGAGLNMPGGASGTNNQVRLPDNIDAGMDEEFSVSIWTRPNALPNWVPLLQIGSSTDTFFLLQSSTQVNGPTGFAATFKAPGTAAVAQERLTLGGGNDLPLAQWTNVVFTMSGSTGRLYFDGVLVGTRTDFTLGIGDIGVGGNTTANMIGGTSFPDPRWNGLVDDFRMYGYELTADQVGGLYQGETPVNAAPVGVEDTYVTDQDETLTVVAPGVLANDTDADSNPLTATGLTQPANGTVTLMASGGFSYVPDAGYSGTDTFTYRANDGTVDSAATTVTITVTEVTGPTNATPVAIDDTYVTDQGVTLTVAAPGVLGNDTDADSDPLTTTGLTQPTHGDVTLSAAGALTYSPDSGFSGVDSFTYRANDGTVSSAPATVSVTVNEGVNPPGNHAPVAVADVFLTQQDVALVVAAPGVLGNDADADGDDLTAIRVNQPVHGQVTMAADGSFVYVPQRGFSGYDMFVYKVNDGTIDSGLTTVTIAVDAVPPAATAIAAVASSYSYGQRGVVSTAVAPDTATGEVFVLLGTRRIARGTLSAGSARVVLPTGSVPPGSRPLTVQYAGDAAHAASSTTISVTVRKGISRLKVTAPKQVKQGRRVGVRIKLTAPGGVPVTGKVKVKVAGRTLTGTLRAGVVTVRLPPARKVGPMRVTVTYRGSNLATKAVKAVTIRVRR